MSTKTRQATKADCRAIAELALLAGEGIPEYFWGQAKEPGQPVLDYGAQKAASETGNFSYRNVHVAVIRKNVAGMLLAYRLPEVQDAESLEEYPDFIRPLIELEHFVPGSFYINMLAVFPKYRNKGVGSALMRRAEEQALKVGCTTVSVAVFEQNEEAVRLYQHLGYAIVDKRRVVPHPCYDYTGSIALLTKQI
jgi:ribosomal protein S18 acetylase RimI-like enzyme